MTKCINVPTRPSIPCPEGVSMHTQCSLNADRMQPEVIPIHSRYIPEGLQGDFLWSASLNCALLRMVVMVVIMMAWGSAWGQTFDNQAATFSWAVGNENAASLSAGISEAVSQTKVSVGSDLKVTSTAAKYTLAAEGTVGPYCSYQPSTNNPGCVATDMIEYTVQLKNGLTFTPTSVSFDAVKEGTDGAYFSWSYTIDGTESDITAYSDPKTQIRRNNNANPSAPLTHNESITATGGKKVTLRLYISNVGNTKVMSIGNVKVCGTINGTVASRTFSDFKIDFQTNPMTVMLPADGNLPSGVSVEGTSYNGAQHGVQNGTIKVPVDGPVEFTIGSCQYGSHKVTVKDAGGNTLAEIDNNNGCDKANEKTKYVKWKYNKEEETTLTFTVDGYLPFFYAEKCEYVPEVTVTYYNTTGQEIGHEVVAGSSALAYKYGAADVTVPVGHAFRGWFSSNTSDATKVAEGTSVNSDLSLYAKETEIEVAADGKEFVYDLSKANFYQEDHELIEMSGHYHNNHGWNFGANGTIKLTVAGKADIVLTECQFSNEGNITITNAGGEVVCDPVSGKAASCGDTQKIEYRGPATTLTLTILNGAYMTKVTVQNLVRGASDLAIPSGKDIRNIGVGDSFTLTKGTDYSTTGTGAISFSSSDVNVATVDSETGEVNGVAYGTATITIHQAADDDHAAGEKAITVKVNDGRFTDMKLDFRNGAFITSSETSALTIGVKQDGEAFVRCEPTDANSLATVTGKYHSGQHGLQGFTMQVAVPGAVKITVGACGWGGNLTITNEEGTFSKTINTMLVSGSNCYDGTSANTIVTYYDGGAGTLTISGGNYMSYISIERVEEVPALHTVTFMNGSSEVSTKQVYAGSVLGVLPACPSASGKQCIGWYTATDGTGMKVSASMVVNGNVTYYANMRDDAQLNEGTGFYEVGLTSGDSNGTKGDKLIGAIMSLGDNAERKKLFIPNGTYDLRNAVLTKVGNYVSLIGESMEGVVIQNAPDLESINNTATLLTGNNVVMQNVTLKCVIEESARTSSGGSGYNERGVCLQDNGTGNVYRKVRLLGRQDTYYSRDGNVNSYFEDCEIHGTVDFICGRGNVWFEHCDLVIEQHNVAYITAAATGYSSDTYTDGYTFNNCTIKNADGASMNGKYYLGRAWQYNPKVAFHNTIKEIAYKEAGWAQDMNTVSSKTFVESNDEKTTSIPSVKTNGAKPAAPANIVLSESEGTKTLTWNAVEGVTGYAVYKNGTLLAITTSTTYQISSASSAKKRDVQARAAATVDEYSVASISATGIVGDAALTAKAPVITKNVADATGYVGKPMTLGIEATDAVSYQWYKSATKGSAELVAQAGNIISGATAATYTYTASAEGTAYLCCVATNTQGSTKSAVAAVTAQNPVITQDLKSEYGAKTGEAKELSIVAEGGYSYQWYCSENETETAIEGATSSLLSYTPAADDTYYIYCRVNNAVNSTITTLTATSSGASTEKTQHAGQPIEEVYDFATLVAGGAPTLTTNSTSYPQTGTNAAAAVYEIDNPTGTKSGLTLELNHRFAVDYNQNSATTLRWMWRQNAAAAYQNGMAGNWNGKGSSVTHTNLSVLGLYAGDKVTITYAVRAGKSAQLHACSGDQLTGVAATSILTSAQEYTVAANGQLDLYITDNNMAIQSIKIKTEYYATAEPSITADLAAMNAYVGVPRVVAIAASDADNYQWYRNSIDSKTGATPIDGATSNTYVYTPEAVGTEYLFCVASNDNGSKSSSLAAVTASLPELMTLDFINRTDDEKTFTLGAQNGTASNGSANLATYNVEYPYDLKGYLATYGFNEMSIGDGGLTNKSTSGYRVAKLLSLTAGDIVTFIGDGLIGNMGVPSGGTKIATDNIATVVMTADGDLGFWLTRGQVSHIQQIILTKKATPVFTTNLNEKYFVVKGNAQTLTVATSPEGASYQWYRNTINSNKGGTLIEGATEASYIVPTTENSTYYYYCIATNPTTNTVAVSNVAQVDVADVIFRDFELDVRQKRDYGLTEAEAVKGKAVDFGVLVDEAGGLSRTSETANVNVRVEGTYESTELGLKNAKFTVPVQGKVKFSIGKTGVDAVVTVKDAAGNTIATLNTKGGKWASNKKNVAYGYYTGAATTLTFTVASGKCVPYIRVEAVDVAELNAPVITVGDWSAENHGYTVTMTNTEPSAKMLYTLDGTEPGQGSEQYSETMYITANTTIKAYAVCDGWYDSQKSQAVTGVMPTFDQIIGDEITSVTVNGVALSEEQVTAFKSAEGVTIATEYIGVPTIEVGTKFDYNYTIDAPVKQEDGSYVYTFYPGNNGGKATLTGVKAASPKVTFDESKFYFAKPNRGYKVTYTPVEDAITNYIKIDDGEFEEYSSAKTYYAVESVQTKVKMSEEYTSEPVTYSVESTNYDPHKPFAAFIYAGGYTDQNIEPKPLEAKPILEGIEQTYNLVVIKQDAIKYTDENEVDNLGAADLIVLSEAMSSSATPFLLFDSKDGKVNSKVKKMLGLGTTNILNLKIYALKSSVWNWGTPNAIDTKTLSITPTNPMYSVFNGVTFNDDADHSIDLWTENVAPLTYHLQGISEYTAKGTALGLVTLAKVGELDVLQYRNDASGKVLVNFGININDYAAFGENTKTIIGNVCRMINDGTDLSDKATTLTKPTITDNGDGSATISTSTSLATLYYKVYDAEPASAPTAEEIKAAGLVAHNRKTKQFAKDKYIYAYAEMDLMEPSPVSEACLVLGSPMRKITRRSLYADGAIGEEVTLEVDASQSGLKVPYNQSFKKDGYSVTSWMDANTGTVYVPGTDLVLDQDLDLVAQWTENTKAITDLCGAEGEQRKATFHFLHKDGAPWYSLDGTGNTGVLVGQVRFSEVAGDFIDVFLDIENRAEVVNPINGVSYGGKFNNTQENAVNWFTGDGTQRAEYCQVKTGTTFTFPAVNGMTVNFKAIDLEQDNLLNLHRSYVNSSTLSDGEIQNPAYDLIAGNYVFSRDNYEAGGNYSYHGSGKKAEFTVMESSLVYSRTDVSKDKSTVFDNDASFNHGSCFMQSFSVTYPALYKVTPTLNPAKSELVADGSEPTATLIYLPEPAGNTDGKFLSGTEVTMTVTPSYAYKFTGVNEESGAAGTTTLYAADNSLPVDGGKYVFTVGSSDVAMTVNMQKLGTYTFTTGVYPIGTGRVDLEPNYTSFAEGRQVELIAVPKMGYQFKHWSKAYSNEDKYKYPSVTTEQYELTVNSETAAQSYYAVFEPGKEGTVHYLLDKAVLLNADGTTKIASYNMSVEERAGFPESITKTAMVIPVYYTMYKEGYTLSHWEGCNADGSSLEPEKKYEIGTHYYFENEGDERYIKPVFIKNKTDFDYRTTPVDITWDFRRAYYAQTIDASHNATFRYSTHATINKVTDGSGVVTMDVPILVSTGAKGEVDNTDHDEWITIGEGTTLTLPSGLGATFTLASYALLQTTEIDGVVPDKYTLLDDQGTPVYLYSYTTTSASTSVTLTIGDDYAYYKFINAKLPSADKVGVNVSVNNSVMGSAVVKSAGTVADGEDLDVTDLGAGDYSMPLGAVVTITAKRNRLYEFVRWEDENGNELTGSGYDITTDVDARTDEVTSTIIFTVNQYQTYVKAVFKDREQYQINYTAGSVASGIAPAVQVIEKGEQFTLPEHNQVLYYEGHTLKYWVDEAGSRYDFGQSYVPKSDVLLSPVFLPNEFAFSDILNDVTMTWPLAVAQGATDINYRGSSGLIVDQLEYEGMKIDLKLDIKSTSTAIRAYNNTNDQYCLVTDGITMIVPSMPGCKIMLNSYSENVSRTMIAGATSEEAGAIAVSNYTAGMSPTVTVKSTLDMGTQSIDFKGDSPSFTSISVTYTALTDFTLPELATVTIGGVGIGTGDYSKYSIVDLNSDKELSGLKVEATNDKLPAVVATSSGKNAVLTITQPTVENPQALILLKSQNGILAGVYKLNFDVAKVEGNLTLDNVVMYRKTITATEEDVYDAGTVAPNSVASLTFSRSMVARVIEPADIEVKAGHTGTFHDQTCSSDGKTLNFTFWGLDKGKTYDFVVKAGVLEDIYGNKYNHPIHFRCVVSEKDIQTAENRVFDFVVTHRETFDHSKGRDKASQITMAKTQVASDDLIENLKAAGIPYGTIDEGVDLANATSADTRRSFRIFVPDGEYQLGGNDAGMTAFNPRRDFSDNKDLKTIYVNSATDPYNNGMTYIMRDRVSVIGQSQNKTVLYNDPYFYGISYSSTMEVRQNKSDCYFQDLTFDNRYSNYQMAKGAKPGGQTPAFYDRGKRTILKNVSVLSYQDSYVSDVTSVDDGHRGRGYYETSTFAGTVDYLCGDGDIWWERCTFLMRHRASNNFIAPRQKLDEQKWGYVLNECVIDAEGPKVHAYQPDYGYSYQDTYEINSLNYHLGRPWEESPAVTFLNTKMILQPAPEGYMNMKDAGLVMRFHEYGSVDANGTPIDLSSRTLRLSTPGPGSFDAVMTEKEAAEYTLHNALGCDEGYDPTVYTAQQKAVENLGFDDRDLNWKANEGALCYFIFHSDTENGEYKLYAITEQTLYDCKNKEGWYMVRAANQRGGLGEPTEPIEYRHAETYDLVLNETKCSKTQELLKAGKGWSTICLPWNARVPSTYKDGSPISDKFKVYAVVKIQNNVLTLRKVDYVTKDKGYVVYGDAPQTYEFRESSHDALYTPGYPYSNDSYLDGNSGDSVVSATGRSCYTLSFKPAISGLGFYKYTGANLKPYKAYMSAVTFVEHNNTSDSEATVQEALKRGIILRFEDSDEVVDIKEIDAAPTVPTPDDGKYYDLTGRPVLSPEKGGVYIRNRRKIVFR